MLLMISLIWWNIFSLFVLLLLIMILGMDEFLRLIRPSENSYLRKGMILIGSFLMLCIFLTRIQLFPEIFILYSLLTGIMLICINLWATSRSFLIDFRKVISGFLYILLPLSLTLYIVKYDKHDYSPDLLLIILVLIWIYDSLAYITGVLFGKHKIMPSVSPKKTWEGLIGGLMFTLLAAWLISMHNLTYTTSQWIIISLIVVIAGTTGDFFESFLKRKAGVKDSGRCLPGHGGILDRFDSFLFIIPVVFVYVKLII